MIFKKYFESIIFNEDVPVNVLGQTAAKLTGGDKRKKEEAKEKVKEIADQITTPYEDLPPKEGGQHVHLPKIIDWILRGEKVEQVKQEYDSYMSLPKELQINVNINVVKDFKKFTELVHRAKSSQIQIDKGEYTDNKTLNKLMQDIEVKDALVYQDDKIAVFWSKSHSVSRKLSCGDDGTEEGKFGLCIGREEPEYFYSYLLDHNLTTYFVYFKTKESREFHYKGKTKIHTSPFLILDIGNVDGGLGYLWNTVTSLETGDVENNDVRTSDRDMLNTFPSLSGFLESDEWKWRTPSKKSITDYFEDSSAFINISKNVWKSQSDVFKSIAIQWFEQNPGDAYYLVIKKGWNYIPDEIKPIAIKGLEREPSRAGEYAIKYGWENTPKEIKPIAMKGLEKDPVIAGEYAIKYGWENTPDELKPIAIKGFEKDPSIALKFADIYGWENTPDEIKPIAMKGLEKDPISALKFANTYGWENTPDELKPSIFQELEKDPRWAFTYVFTHGWEKTPKEIKPFTMKWFEINPLAPCYYAIKYGLENTPDELKPIAIKGFEREPSRAGEYAIKYGWENTPDELKPIAIKGFEKDSYRARASSYAVKYGLENTPDEIKPIAMKGIEKEPSSASEYAFTHGWEKTPKEIKPNAMKGFKQFTKMASNYEEKWGNKPWENEAQLVSESLINRFKKVLYEN